MSGDLTHKTFRDLDGNFPLPAPASALELWYIEIRDIPFAELSDFHLARAMRQREHLEAVVPVSLRHLEDNPLAGDILDGELLRDLSRLPRDYWLAHPDQYSEFERIGKRVLECVEDILPDTAWLFEAAHNPWKWRGVLVDTAIAQKREI